MSDKKIETTANDEKLNELMSNEDFELNDNTLAAVVGGNNVDHMDSTSWWYAQHED